MLQTQKYKKSFKELLAELKGVLVGEWLTDMSNFSAFMMMELENLNWVGFYLLNGQRLCLGPFQGKPACTEVKIGRGVCGLAAETQKITVVDDVQQFADHIVCDPESHSEIVVPLIYQNQLIGVLDVDSPLKFRFQELEIQNFLKASVEIFLSQQKKVQPHFF